MPGWVPFDADGWEETAEGMTDAGLKWTRAAAIFDLRWHVDQSRKIPGRPTLRARWNRTDHWVRTLLKDEDAWRDPSKKDRQPTASRPPARRQRTASASPGQERLNLDNGDGFASAPPASRQAAASGSPAELHTRTDPPSPSPVTLTDPPSPQGGTGWTERIRSHLPDKPTRKTAATEVDENVSNAPEFYASQPQSYRDEQVDNTLDYRLTEWRDFMDDALARPPEVWADRLISRQRHRPPALPAIGAALAQLLDEHQQAQEGP